jgi:transaldolase/glucose-6-phosphate isomerase
MNNDLKINSIDSTYLLGDLKNPVLNTVKIYEGEQLIKRIFEHDPTIWTEDPLAQEEILHRLGWLDLPATMDKWIVPLEKFRDECINDGYKNVIVLGMGGSSLAPEVLSLILGKTVPDDKFLKLKIIDTTNPDEILYLQNSIELKHTLFLISSKSGTTSETLAGFHFFWQEVEKVVGKGAGRHFVAITDPGSTLENLAKEFNFRKIFHGEPSVGGRFSVFTMFGLVPAALIGLDLNVIINRAKEIYDRNLPLVPAIENPGLVLGVFIGEADRKGINKLTIVADEPLEPMGAWLEQLIAESSGKDGKGIVPLTGEPMVDPEQYGKDRLFVYLKLSGDFDKFIAEIYSSGHPIVILNLQDNYSIIGEFYRWEIATAVACAVLKVNAFDQPDVQRNKARTKDIILGYQQTGRLEEGQSIWSNNEANAYGTYIKGIEYCSTLSELVSKYMHGMSSPKFIAINAFLPRTSEYEVVLKELRLKILKLTNCATTLGFGPRFLHSTGQLHKGGKNEGLFIILTSSPQTDIDIPGEGLTFGTLQKAQALGDQEVLRMRNRIALRIHLTSANPIESLRQLVEKF